MEYNLDNGLLTIHLEGEMNSYNSEMVEKEIEKIVTANSFSSLKIDMEKVSYISSAGIRVIVGMMKICPDIVLAKVGESVYNVFDMVGFTERVKIEKL